MSDIVANIRRWLGRARETTESAPTVACIVDCKNLLGEACVWDPRNESLYWTDIVGSCIYRFGSDRSLLSYPLGERAAFVLPRTEPGFVVGFEKRIALANPDLTQFTTVHDIEPDMPQTRVNDAAVDPLGGIVFGTMDEKNCQRVASLYRLGPDLRLERLLGEVAVSNGLAFSPDGSVMYFADSPTGVIRRFGIDDGFARLQELEPLTGPTIAPGVPDGATVDLEGNYWSARAGGGCLVRISPDGHLSRRVDLAVAAPTCVALGGKSGTTLFATTMRLGQSKKQLRKTPQAGGLFAAEVDIAGDPQRLCLL